MSIRKHVGIGTSYSNDYPDDTVSSSCGRSTRSNVQVVIKAANKEKNELIRQIHVN